MKEENSAKTVGVPELTKGQFVALSIAFLICFAADCDLSVISTVSVKMLADIGGEAFYSVLLSIKMTTLVVCSLITGRLVEKLGRRTVALLGVALMTLTNLGSALCSSMTVMIVTRAIAGAGMGFLVTTLMIMVGELFGKKSGYGYLVTLVGYGVGNTLMPVLAGRLADTAGWRMIFFVFVGMGVVVFFVILATCPNYTIAKAVTKLDIKGIALFSVAIATLVVVLSFGGGILAWTSPVTLGLIAVCLLFFVLFFVYEKTVDQEIALLPVSTLRSKLIIGCAVGQLAMTINSTILYSYIPYYMQLEMGATSTAAATSTSIISLLTTIVGAILLTVMVKMQRNSEFGRFTVTGEAVALIAVYIFLSPTMKVSLMFVLMVVYGLTQSVETYAFTMTVQSGVPKSQIAVSTAVIVLCRNCAGILGTAVSTPIISSAPSFGAGVHNVFLMAMIVTVAGAVAYWRLVPGTKKINAALAAAQAGEDAAR